MGLASIVLIDTNEEMPSVLSSSTSYRANLDSVPGKLEYQVSVYLLMVT